ncbi:HEXXH motif-containing putative peptide modification protein [Lentzea sp. BCCO 10_0061]|uniref:HEXXH motif-containing putative peptide modification protein n=1 Tax=Lentzea sokolovensis TaxID=3095429 RepID=A0ABU4V573_9PSEU|nr:HEXXH motif-containing putative peptide modification protein [Lentzea sp. BCCO 10_0061]MDX8146938.1 HEXXH motif-containing putative peptide modification protein [Lentzea sp. BCCO 10_0061]
MTTSSAEEYLRNQLTSFEMSPGATDALATVYHRRLGRRLWSSLAEQGTPPAGPDGWRQLTWLHPSVVRMVTTGPIDADALHAADANGAMYTVAGGPPRPPLEHLPERDGVPWLEESVRYLEHDIQMVDAAQSLTLSRQLAESSQPHVDQAVDVLAHVWPAAAQEFRTLVQSIAYVDGTVFRSATVEQTYGVIYAAPQSLGSVAAAFEMLLHETGHHALYLRNSFGPFVLNGSALASHPLRPDPRPIFGVLHSAHVLARMATGLHRWTVDADAPDEAHERREQALKNLSQSLDVLGREAEWTTQGIDYFKDLRACEDSLRAA